MVRMRRVGAAVLAAAAVLTASACSGGTPQQGPTTFAPRPTTGLAALLVTPPPSSQAGSSTWARTYRPSVKQYVDEFYGTRARTRITATLTQQQLQEVAHTLWVTIDDIQSDTVVLRFAGRPGAAAQFAFLKKTNEGAQDRKSYTIDAPGTPVVYYDTKPGKKGFRLARAYAQVGTYVVELFVYTPTDIPKPRIQSWLRDQVDLLTTP